MNLQKRIQFWHKLAQTATTINLQNIPTFMPGLFANNPNIIQDLNRVASIYNKYLLQLSQNKIGFNLTWQNPTIDQADFTASMRYLYGLAKWLYRAVSQNSPAYSVEGLAKLARDLATTIMQTDLPEIPNIKGEIVAISNDMLNKLGGGK